MDYIQKVADKHDVTKHVRYDKNVDRLQFVEESHIWKVYTKEGDEFSAHFIISAVGQLHHPKIPKFEASNQFKGESLHTAQFRSKKVELGNFVGKRVAVIGTGASAIQLIPELQKVSKKIHLYQRTPSYIFPKFRFSHMEEKMMQKYPLFRSQVRKFLVWFPDVFLFSAFQSFSWWGVICRQTLTSVCNLNLRCNMKNVRKRDVLIPHYPIGAKRILFSDDFYPAVDKPNVEINSTGINKLNNVGIINLDGSVTEVDTIVYATGFITNPFLYGISVIGRSNKQLWDDEKGAHAYLGVTTSGFPNLFFLYGPNTNTGHASVILFLEEQVKFVLRAIHHVKVNGHKSIEVKSFVEDAFNEEIQKVSKELCFTKVVNSWYLFNGRLINNWIGSVQQYVDRISGINFSKDFEFHGQGDLLDERISSDSEIVGPVGTDRVDLVQNRRKINFNGIFSAVMRIPFYSAMIANQVIQIGMKLMTSKLA